MYYYAILDKNGVCATVFESSEQKTSLDDSTIQLEYFDKDLLGHPWNGSEWVPFSEDPEKNFWNGSEWVSRGYVEISEDEIFINSLGLSIAEELTSQGHDVTSEELISSMAKQRFLELKGYEFNG